MAAAAVPSDLGGAIQSQATSPGGESAVYATEEILVSADRLGTEQWRFEFGPVIDRRGVSLTDCAYSADGAVVWLYLPEMCTGRGVNDRWLTLDAADGTVLDETALTVPGGGQGALHFPHPDGVHMLLDVGCGQDGSYVHLGRTDQGRMICSPWPSAASPTFGELCITDIAADGNRVAATDHAGTEVSVLDFPSGNAELRFTLADFGFDVDADQLSTVFLRNASFLDQKTVLVQFVGETDEPDPDRPAPDWADAGLGEFQDFTAYQVVDLTEQRVIGPADADGAHDGPRPRSLAL
jgi:hypothetical protein